MTSDRPPLAETFDLHPHPEGGWFRETWVSGEQVELPDGRRRPLTSLILYLVPRRAGLSWYRIASDQVWLAHTGTVVIQRGGRGESPEAEETWTLSTDIGTGQVAQVVTAAGEWQRILAGPADALVSCVTTPAFLPEDWTYAPVDGA